jgi:sialic acid synthase SpsE/spore coat polysaccharide biosynthesis protein SpsF (cytidylyltransferase family)
MKTVVIIQARMGSTRLRGKSLMPVNGVSLLERVINTAKSLAFVDEVRLATTTLQEDEPIHHVCKALNVKSIQGSTLNVLERFIKASSDLDELDTIVRLTADNPFNLKEISKAVFDKHIEGKYDYSHIDGLSHVVAEFINVRALREVFQSTNLDNFDTEHVTPYFRKHRTLFKVQTLPNNFLGLKPEFDRLLTIDNLEDLHRVEKLLKDNLTIDPHENFDQIYQALSKNNNQFSHSDSLITSLNGIEVGDELPTYIIAEIGQNHNGNIELAKKLIEMAVRCKANAVKFQKRDIPSELTTEAYNKPYDNPNSFGKTYGEHREFLEFNEEQHVELKEYASALGITYFCTPCDVPSLELLERIGCPFYKVASRDLTNIPLLIALGKTGKPVIISTGMADFEDIDDAIEALNIEKSKLIIMQCTSEYPCKLENVNLNAIKTLKDKYKVVVGLSDHTSGVIISAAAPLMGASIIEKHITLDRTMKGTDQPGSLEEAGLNKLVNYIRAIEIAKGDGIKDVNPATKAAKDKLARSITSAVDIKMGTVITEDMLCLKSPGIGLKWKQKNLIEGKKAIMDIPANVTIALNHVQNENN